MNIYSRAKDANIVSKIYVKPDAKQARCNGFSLIELLIALAVFSLLLLSLSQSLQKTQLASHKLNENHRQSSKLIRAIELITRDIRLSGSMGCALNNAWLFNSTSLDINTENNHPDTSQNHVIKSAYLIFAKNTMLNQTGSDERIPFSKLELIYTEKNSVNLNEIGYTDKNRAWLMHHDSCRTGQIMIPNALSAQVKARYALSPSFLIRQVNYAVKRKNNSWVLSREQLSKNNNVYSRPLLSHVKHFDISVLTPQGFVNIDAISDWHDAIALFVTLSLYRKESLKRASDEDSETINNTLSISRLVPLFNNMRYHYSDEN